MSSKLTGDRENDLSALEGREWDVVIDNSGRRVEWTRDSAELLKDSAHTYVYTSSTGVYLPYLGTDISEDTEVLLEDPPEVPEERRPSYGVMKSLSELEARKAFGDDRTIVVRPTYIVGPGVGGSGVKERISSADISTKLCNSSARSLSNSFWRKSVRSALTSCVYARMAATLMSRLGFA